MAFGSSFTTSPFAPQCVPYDQWLAQQKVGFGSNRGIQLPICIPSWVVNPLPKGVLWGSGTAKAFYAARDAALATFDALSKKPNFAADLVKYSGGMSVQAIRNVVANSQPGVPGYNVGHNIGAMFHTANESGGKVAGTNYTARVYVQGDGSLLFGVQRPDEFVVFLSSAQLGKLRLDQVNYKALPSSAWQKGGFNRGIFNQFLVSAVLAVTAIAVAPSLVATPAAETGGGVLSADTGFFGAGPAPDLFTSAGLSSTSSIVSAGIDLGKTALTTVEGAVTAEGSKLVDSTITKALTKTPQETAGPITAPQPSHGTAVIVFSGLALILFKMGVL